MARILGSAVLFPLSLEGRGRIALASVASLCNPGEGGFEEKQKPYTLQAQGNAKRLRKNLSDAEHRLWQRLRDRQIANCKFRRQQAVGNYIADFVCFEKKLIVELDGSQHITITKAHDIKRDQFLSKEGFQVLRFWSNEVLQNTDGVVEVISNTLTRRLSAPTSPLKGEVDWSCNEERL